MTAFNSHPPFVFLPSIAIFFFCLTANAQDQATPKAVAWSYLLADPTLIRQPTVPSGTHRLPGLLLTSQASSSNNSLYCRGLRAIFVSEATDLARFSAGYSLVTTTFRTLPT